VTTEGGFINPSARLGQLPTVAVDSDGHIYMADPDATGGAITKVALRDVGSAGAAQILAAMRAAGLDVEGDDGGVVADTGVTIFTAVIDGDTFVNRVTANGPGGPGHPGGGDNPALDLLTQLTDPSVTWGATDVTSTEYVPVAYRVYDAPAAGEGVTVDWPLATPLADFGTPATPDFGVEGLRSGIVFGDDATTLVNTFTQPEDLVSVQSDGGVYQLWIRPLLPYELG
jgi:hypothetical protein